MVNRFKAWTVAAVLVGGCMLANGCGNWRLWMAMLNEDIFG